MCSLFASLRVSLSDQDDLDTGQSLNSPSSFIYKFYRDSYLLRPFLAQKIVVKWNLLKIFTVPENWKWSSFWSLVKINQFRSVNVIDKVKTKCYKTLMNNYKLDDLYSACAI